MNAAVRAPNKELRSAVLKQIALVMYQAEKSGQEPFKVADRTFPGTPLEILATAYSYSSDIATEEWWQAVEDTIDGEVIRTAVVTIDHKSQAKRE